MLANVRANVMAWKSNERHKSEISLKQIMSSEFHRIQNDHYTWLSFHLQCGFQLFHQNLSVNIVGKCIFRCAALNHTHIQSEWKQNEINNPKPISEAIKWEFVSFFFKYFLCFFFSSLFCWSLEANLMKIDKDH